MAMDVGIFLPTSMIEAGQIGTAMFCYHAEDAPEYVLEKNATKKPVLMGVYTGTQQRLGAGNEDLVPRGLSDS